MGMRMEMATPTATQRSDRDTENGPGASCVICIHLLYSSSTCQTRLRARFATAVSVLQACNCLVFGRHELKHFTWCSTPAIVGVLSSWHLWVGGTAITGPRDGKSCGPHSVSAWHAPLHAANSVVYLSCIIYRHDLNYSL